MFMGRDFGSVEVKVNYGLSYEDLATSLGVNGNVGLIIRQTPSWSVVDVPPDKAIVTVRVRLYYHDGSVSVSPAHKQMATLHLRPVIFPEFRAVICEVARRYKLACLGTLWNPSQLLCWEGGRGRLAFSGHMLGKDFVFPAVDHVGNWNRR